MPGFDVSVWSRAEKWLMQKQGEGGCELTFSNICFYFDHTECFGC